MKDLGVFGSEFFFFTLTAMGKTWQSISSYICLTLEVIDKKLIPRKFLGLPDLPGTQTLAIHKLAEIIVIGKHMNLISATLQVVVPSLKDFNYGQ